MEKAMRMVRATAVMAATLMGVTALAAALLGCGPKREPCFEAVSINPGKAFGIVFDKCEGKFVAVPLLGVPMPAPPPEAEEKSAPAPGWSY